MFIYQSYFQANVIVSILSTVDEFPTWSHQHQYAVQKHNQLLSKLDETAKKIIL